MVTKLTIDDFTVDPTRFCDMLLTEGCLVVDGIVDTEAMERLYAKMDSAFALAREYQPDSRIGRIFYELFKPQWVHAFATMREPTSFLGSRVAMQKYQVNWVTKETKPRNYGQHYPWPPNFSELADLYTAATRPIDAALTDIANVLDPSSKNSRFGYATLATYYAESRARVRFEGHQDLRGIINSVTQRELGFQVLRKRGDPKNPADYEVLQTTPSELILFPSFELPRSEGKRDCTWHSIQMQPHVKRESLLYGLTCLE